VFLFVVIQVALGLLGHKPVNRRRTSRPECSGAFRRGALHRAGLALSRRALPRSRIR
jgi:hypothetical protein